ncbi:uncharacterized protein LOC110726219 [Chenopodium quinoa]|uniref:uncharacterized protein LOC110726219 n=1 Tax=Chenopodium quinoa TaxID=63459 RepID=UPI000B788739|nr:uncharacterized protein LOC110726219 [Chenopodium quinoa]
MVAEGNAQPPSERLQVHFQSIPMGYFAIEVYKVHDGFEDLTVARPSKDSNILKLRDAIGSLILWLCAWLRISAETLQKTKAPKRKKTDTQASNIGPQLGDLNEQRNQKTEIKGSIKTLLVGLNVLGSLSKACNWLHINVCGLPDGNPIAVDLTKSFCNSPEDAKTWIFKADVSLFLSGDMVTYQLCKLL